MSSGPSISGTPTIVILDDDKLSTHNLALQFRFMGEQPRCIASDNWYSLLQNLKSSDEYSQLLAIAVGQVQRSNRKALLASLQDYDAKLPLLLLDDTQVEPADRSGDGEPVATAAQVIVLNPKGLNYERLRLALEQAAAFSGRQRTPPPSAIISASGSALFRSLSGTNAAIEQLRALILQVAARDVTALIQGESGVGKEVVARNLHYHSGRGGKPFIAVNCAALVPANMGAELFGSEELVNGQTRVQHGLVEQAAGGTIFFDQISELPINLQAVLLRFLEDRQFQRIGGFSFVSTDVRVVVGTGHDLLELIAQNKFREDLYYRLNTMPLQVPPLREREEDIPELIKELIARLESKGHPAVRLNASAVQSLQRHQWPGNVRELANLIERLGIIQPDIVTGIQDLPLQYQYPEPEPEPAATAARGNEQAEPEPARAVSGAAQDGAKTSSAFPGPGGLILPLDQAKLAHYLESFERQMLQTALEDCGGILSFTGERLALDEAALKAKLQLHGLGV